MKLIRILAIATMLVTAAMGQTDNGASQAKASPTPTPSPAKTASPASAKGQPSATSGTTAKQSPSTKSAPAKKASATDEDFAGGEDRGGDAGSERKAGINEIGNPCHQDTGSSHCAVCSSKRDCQNGCRCTAGQRRKACCSGTKGRCRTSHKESRCRAEQPESCWRAEYKESRSQSDNAKIGSHKKGYCNCQTGESLSGADQASATPGEKGSDKADGRRGS